MPFFGIIKIVMVLVDVMNKEAVIAEKKAIDFFGMQYLDYRDKNVIQFVIRSLKDVNAKVIVGKNTDFNSVALDAISDMGKTFGADIEQATAACIARVPFRSIMPNSHEFTANILFGVNPITGKIDSNGGFIDHFKITEHVYEEDRIFLGHELVHVNKELNLDEYRLFLTYSDVIPMLYEFVVMRDKAYEVINNRFALLKTETKRYNDVTKHMKSGKDKDLYKVLQSRAGQYLNSFYYAVVLYKMYKNDSKMILDYMKRVMKCEMTTLDMLKDLGIHLVDNHEYYNEQMQEFKSIIRK